MIYKTRGIVFRSVKYSESSVVSKIYTEKFGMQSYIINGVRTSKSKFKGGLLQSLSLLDMEVYYRENKNLNRIKEFNAAHVFTSVPFNSLKGTVGLFLIEVLKKSIHEEEVNEPLFHFIFEKIKSLDEFEAIPSDFLLSFLISLSALLGFFPNGKFSHLTPHFNLREGVFTSQEVNPEILDASLSQILSSIIQRNTLQISSSQRSALLTALLHYYKMHVPDFSQPKSLAVLEEVFKK